MRLLTLLLCIGLLLSNKSDSRFAKASPPASKLKSCQNLSDGDVVLRSGKGFISDMMRNTSMKEKRFSHAGLIIILNNEPQVVHCIASEQDPEGGIVIQPLADFVSPAENKSFAIYRYPITDNIRRQVRKSVLRYSSAHVTFDKSFDLSTDNALYCSEFVYKVLETASGNTIGIEPTRVKKGDYIGIDDLYLNTNCSLLIDSTYTQ
ncbi:MAG TPA: YiiX/YebB-like N1pC/P60 family cysteine hydrolase [Bacteroidia bacterium]|nr:YiiX/YebB-like N1pC/P60 family cysteine hydrolase [Bacteroidia bacterium]